MNRKVDRYEITFRVERDRESDNVSVMVLGGEPVRGAQTQAEIVAALALFVNHVLEHPRHLFRVAGKLMGRLDRKFEDEVRAELPGHVWERIFESPYASSRSGEPVSQPEQE